MLVSRGEDLYKTTLARDEDAINDLKSRLGNLRERRAKIEKDIDETTIIFEKASRAAAQYEAKIKVVKEVMHEDYSIAKLKEDFSFDTPLFEANLRKGFAIVAYSQ